MIRQKSQTVPKRDSYYNLLLYLLIDWNFESKRKNSNLVWGRKIKSNTVDGWTLVAKLPPFDRYISSPICKKNMSFHRVSIQISDIGKWIASPKIGPFATEPNDSWQIITS